MTELEIKVTGELQTISLKPGDALVARFDSRLTQSSLMHIANYLENAFPGHKVVILDKRAELSILRSES